MAKLTLSQLSKARPGANIPDPAVPGLRYRARPGGLFAQYRWKQGTPRQLLSITLGRVDLTPRVDSTAEALGRLLPGGPVLAPLLPDEVRILEPFRARARALRAAVARGQDPRTPVGDTLGLVAELFLKHVQKRPKTQYERERHLRRDWSALHSRPFAEITKREIAAHVLTLKERSGAASANRARSTLCALFSWADKQGLCDGNPAERAGKVEEPPPPERTLSLAELRRIWQAVDGMGDYGVIVCLLALLGQRREEVGGMLWAELSEDLALWSLPGSRTKNKRPHQVPLPRQAIALLEGRPRHRAHVFGPGDGFTNWSHSKLALDKRCGVAGWRLHHLRHAFVTHSAELGLGMPHVIEAAVNHVSGHKGGVAGIYNRALYAEEKARLLQKWADHLLGEGEAPGEARVAALAAARGAA
jgi:integrase